MKTGFFCLCLIATLALSIKSAQAQQQTQQPGIQPSQPVQQQQPQQQQGQQQGQPQYSQQAPPYQNNGNYVGAPLGGFNPAAFQGMWVSPCLAQIPAYFPSGPAFSPNTFRQMNYLFYSNTVTYSVVDYRDPHCTAALGSPHTEIGVWRPTYMDPTQPLAGEIEFTYDSCGGVGCHPYNPAVGPYAVTRQFIRLYANLLEFGRQVAVQGFSGLVFDEEHPWYQYNTQPGALPAYPQPQMQQQH